MTQDTTPSWPIFKARLLHDEEDADMNRYTVRFRKALHQTASMPPYFRRCHPFCCGEIDLSKPVKGVWYLVSPTVVVEQSSFENRSRCHLSASYGLRTSAGERCCATRQQEDKRKIPSQTLQNFRKGQQNIAFHGSSCKVLHVLPRNRYNFCVKMLFKMELIARQRKTRAHPSKSCALSESCL